MRDVLVFACNAVLPLLLLILAGYCLRRGGLITEEFLRIGNKLVFYVCLPLYLFYNIYQIDNWKDIRLDVLLYAGGMILLFFGMGLLAAHFLISDPLQKGVILQCTFRSNFAIIGIPLSEALGGSEGVAVAALLSAVTIPVYNVLAVISLSVYLPREAGQTKTDYKKIFKKILKNPLIIGVFAGVFCLLIRNFLPQADGEPVFLLRKQGKVLYQAIENVSAIASPLALLVLGGQFSFSSAKEKRREIAIGTVLRVILVPAIALGGTWLLSSVFGGFDATPAVYTAYTALYGTPVAVSSAIMAREMQNDGELAGQLVVWTSLLSLVTLFIFTVILRTAGLI